MTAICKISVFVARNAPPAFRGRRPEKHREGRSRRSANGTGRIRTPPRTGRVSTTAR